MVRPAASVLAALVLVPGLATAGLPEIVERSAGSVVAVEVTPADVRPPSLHRFGAGWVIDPAGHVVTSATLVGGADSVQIRTEDGRRLAARVLGTDPAFDVAVLDPGTRLPALPLGRADLARLGETVAAVTRASGGRVVVRVGVLSTRGGRDGALLDDDLLVDTPLDAAFVGAPLLDAAGRALGLLTVRPPATSPPRRGRSPVGARGESAPPAPPAAVPMDILGEAVRQILEGRPVVWPWIGASLRAGEAGRVEVVSVDAASPLATAGLASGDAIVTLDGRRIRQPADVQRWVLTHPVGRTMTLVWSGADGTHSAELTTRPAPQGPVPAGRSH